MSRWVASSGGSGAGVTVTDTGFDVVLLLGQSNMVGQGTTDARLDAADPRVWAYSGSGTYAGAISSAVEPLAHQAQADGVGPGLPFARWYASSIPGNRRVLLVPAAYDGTSFEGADSFGGGHSWKITTPDVSGNALYKVAVRQAKAALIAAGPNARIVAALWLQGETDAFNSTSGPTYQADLLALIDQLRTDLGNASLPFVIAQMLPDRIATTPAFATIDAVHAAIPGLRSKTAYVFSPFGLTQGDNLHFAPAAQRIIGRSMFHGYLVAAGTGTALPVPGQVTGVVVTPAATTAAVSWANATNATSYYVEYKATASGTWLAGVGSPGSTATITGLTASTSYDFRVTARNMSGSGTASATTTVTTTSAANQSATLSVTSGMAAWYKSDVGVTTATGKVTAWADQSGQGNNLAQATTASQPTFTASGINGAPVLSFSGAQGLTCATGTGLAQTSTTFAVFQQVAGSGTYTVAIVGNVSGGIQYRIDPDLQHAVQSNTADIGFGSSHLTQGSPHIGAVRVNAGSADFFKETGTDGTVTHAAMTFVNTGMQVGWQGGGQGFNGLIGEVIVYGRALSDAEVTTVRQYLGNRYGIVVS